MCPRELMPYIWWTEVERGCLVDIFLTESKTTEPIQEAVKMVNRRDRTWWAHDIGADPG